MKPGSDNTTCCTACMNARAMQLSCAEAFQHTWHGLQLPRLLASDIPRTAVHLQDCQPICTPFTSKKRVCAVDEYPYCGQHVCAVATSKFGPCVDHRGVAEFALSAA